MEMGNDTKQIKWLFWLPNSITACVTICGFAAVVYFAARGYWQWAVGSVVAAAICDFCDGFVARKTGNKSPLGGDLDSLSDMIAFGFAPAGVLYFWALRDAPWFLQLAPIVYVVCALFRLARFNVMDRDPELKKKAGSFFTGLASPSGAAFSLLPLILSFSFADALPFRSSLVVAAVLVVTGLLMISPFPTPSNKNQPRKVFIPTVVIITLGLVVSPFFGKFWLAFAAMVSIYGLTILGTWAYYLWKRFMVVPPLAVVDSQRSPDLGSEEG